MSNKRNLTVQQLRAAAYIERQVTDIYRLAMQHGLPWMCIFTGEEGALNGCHADGDDVRNRLEQDGQTVLLGDHLFVAAVQEISMAMRELGDCAEDRALIQQLIAKGTLMALLRQQGDSEAARARIARTPATQLDYQVCEVPAGVSPQQFIEQALAETEQALAELELEDRHHKLDA